MVTGSHGFLGREVTRQLHAAGHAVIEFDVVNGNDILDSADVKAAVAMADLCIHLAAVADLYEAESDHELCRKVNIEGTRIVAEACAANSVRFIFVSTVCAYGNNGVEVQTECAPLKPTEIYAETKVEAERTLSAIESLDYRVVRPATFYGPGMRGSLAIMRFVDAVKNGRLVEIHGSGTQTRCYTHVSDIASAIVLIAELWPNDLVYNVANPHEVSVTELVDLIGSISAVPLNVRHVSDRRGQIIKSGIDVSKLKSIGWSPSISLEQGLLELL